MFDLGTHLRLSSILRLLRLVDSSGVAVAAVGKVPGSRRMAMNHRRVALVALITPDARLLAVLSLIHI